MTPAADPTVDRVTVYTDGACRGNPGPGGWAWIVPDGAWASGAASDTTNQRMELTAVLEALRAIGGPVEVVSDSTYVVNCFRDRWWEGWLRRDWKNSNRKPVANRDLWEPLVALYRDREAEIGFRWVKGHAGNEWNDIADRLAVEASHIQRGRSGTGVPEDLGPADTTGPGSATAVQAGADGVYPSTWRPAGRAVAVLGLQPRELGGFDENETHREVRRRLGEILAAKKELHPDVVVLTGLRLGAETLAAQAATAHEVPFVAVLPYPEPDARWPAAARRRFAELLDAAAVVVRLERTVPATPQRAGQALDRRNGWLRQVADEAVIVWDGHERRVGEIVTAFERSLGDDVWVLDVAVAD